MSATASRYFPIISYYSYYSSKMTYLKIAIFLAFPLLLCLFAIHVYGNSRFRNAWLALAYSDNCRLFVARLLSLLVIVFHIAYYALFPTDKGIMISSLYVFFSLASKYNMKLLMAIRRSEWGISVLALTAMGIAFLPHSLSSAITLAMILVAVCCLPSRVKKQKSKIQSSLDCSSQS